MPATGTPGGCGMLPRPPSRIRGRAAAARAALGSVRNRPRPDRRPTVRAASYDRYGPAAEVLVVRDVERPVPGPGEVLVKVALSGVNPTDGKSRSGATPRPIDGFQIPHHDGAGVIEAVGDGVDPARTGQRVWLWLAAAGRRWGTAAEWTVVPQDQAVPLPDAASLELGASLGVPAMTAHWCLFADGPVSGKTVLVAGGAGAVGHYAIELGGRAPTWSPRPAARKRRNSPGRRARRTSSTTAMPVPPTRSARPWGRSTGSSNWRSAPTWPSTSRCSSPGR